MVMNTNTNPNMIPAVRLDRWLCAARFFKTRALAKQAIEGGKVHMNGQRSKSGKMLHCGEELSITRGYDRYTVEVVDLAAKRGSAKIAQTLYRETEESIILREKAAALRRIQQLSETSSGHKPDKRQRRRIHQFKQSRTS